MIEACVVAAVGSGVALSWGAVRSASHAPALERAGGLVLIAGLLLLGAMLPIAR